jgi:predicted nucleotidyltransferase
LKFTHNNNEYELLVLTTAGSRLYGNSRPQSDWDYRGVFLAPKETKLGLTGAVEQLEGKDVFKALVNAGFELEETDDVVLYELNRFAKLALDNNPNIMDTLCHNTELDSSLYVSEKGKKLLDAQGLFLSKKSKFTFSGYAVAQLKRIRGHNKWLTQFPHTDEVLKLLKESFDRKEVDWDWLTENFGGQVAEKVTGENAQEHSTFKETETWEFFCKMNDHLDLNKYRVPRLVDYMKAYDLTHRELDMNTFFVSENGNMSRDTLAKFLETEAAFRKFGESTLAVYTGGRGLFGKEGNLKANDSEHLGEFVCLVSVNHNQYKADKDHVNKMWNWKCNRNEKRGDLEEKYGYDTKHASHLVRLMEGAKDLLKTGKYTPELSEDRLKLVNDTRDGKYTYDEVVEYAERLDAELDEMYKTSELKNKPDHKGVNKLVLELQKD